MIGMGRRASPPLTSLSDVAELLGLGEALELLQRLVLDLADALARDIERPPDLVERARVLPAEAVPQLEDAALAVGEVLQRFAQRFLGQDLGGPLVRGLGALVSDELTELRLLLVADRLLERNRRLSGALDRVDLLRIDAGDFGDLLGGGLTAELGDELALGAADLVELLDDVDRDADRPRLVGERAGDRLADPPRRVGRELEAFAVVELLRCANETERPLLDQIQERQTLVAVVLRDGDDEPEVGLDHLLLGIEVTALDPASEVHLFLRGEQAYLADVLQEQLKGIGRHVRLEVDRRLRLATAALVRRAIFLPGREGRVDLFDQLDLGPLEERVQFLEVALVDVLFGQRGRDLSEREDADLLTLEDQPFDFFEFLQIHNRHGCPVLARLCESRPFWICSAWRSCGRAIGPPSPTAVRAESRRCDCRLPPAVCGRSDIRRCAALRDAVGRSVKP